MSNIVHTEISYNASKVLVWADAIRINQHDVEERNVQVSIMREIYQNSQAVQIWLGEEEEDDDKGFDLLRRLLRVSDSHPSSNLTYSIS